MLPKFRGKTIKGLLVVGYVSVVTDKRAGVEPGTYISNSVGFPFAYEVDPKTVGQSTGLKDKNGVEIFEGDILVYDAPKKYAHRRSMHEIAYADGRFFWQFLDLIFCQSNILYRDGYLIIGNIYENPELLEQANE